MRLTFLILFTLVISTLRVNSQSDKPIVSGIFNDLPAESFFEKMSKQYGIRFFYQPEWIDSIKLSNDGEQVTLHDFLAKNFSDSGLSVFTDKYRNVFITRNYPIQSDIIRIYPGEEPDEDLAGTSGFLEREENEAENGSNDIHLLVVGDPGKTPGANAEIAGYVREHNTGEPIIAATIYVDELGTGTVTDIYGHYHLKIPSGRHTLTIRYIGMREINQPVLLQSDGTLNFTMEEQLYRLREIIVEGKRSDNVTGSKMGMNILTAKSIKEIPTVLGEVDIIKVATMLPGVSTVGEGTSGFNVRGGSVDQNLVLIDGAPIFNTSHLFGFFSIFNPDIVKEFELYKAGIPVEYGGRLSSVFDIRSRSGNKLSYGGSGGISPVTAKLIIEGPLMKGKSSFLLGGRSTYSDWILKRISNSDIRKSNASFYDLNARINYEINDKNTLDITGYYSNDLFTLATKTTYNYLNWNTAVRWKYKLSDKLYSENSGVLSNYNYSISSFTSDVDSYQMNFSMLYRELKTKFTWMPNPDHKVVFGFSTTGHTISPGEYLPEGNESQVRELILEDEKGTGTALFLSDRYNISANLSVEAGLRISSFFYHGPRTVYQYDKNLPHTILNITDTTRYSRGDLIKSYTGPEPRLLARYVLGPVSSVKLSYNRTRQYLHLLSNTMVISPTDIWKMSDLNIPPQIADQVAAGYYRNFRNNTIEGSVEIYYKWLNNLIEYKAGAELLLNKHIETELVNGNGKAYGIEFMVRKDHGRFNGWLSYTWSRTLVRVNSRFTEEIINNGEYFPAIYDKPHDLAFLVNYKFSRRFSISNNLIYNTGRPATFPAAKYYYEDIARLHYSLRNEYRIPDYFRWDFSFNIEGNLRAKKLLNSSWSFSVYNITGRENAYSVYFISKDGNINGYKLSIYAQPIFTLTYNFRF